MVSARHAAPRFRRVIGPGPLTGNPHIAVGCPG